MQWNSGGGTKILYFTEKSERIMANWIDLKKPELKHEPNLTFNKKEIELFVTLSDGLTGAEIEIITYDYLRQTVVSESEIDSIELMRKILLSRFH
mgnify:CR=1 FL=1